MSTNSVKAIAAAALIGVLSSAPAFADGWGRGGGYYWGPAAAAGLVGGVLVGGVLVGNALAAAQSGYPAGYPAVYPAGYGVYGGAAPTCYFARQPVVDGWGNLISYRRVRICE